MKKSIAFKISFIQVMILSFVILVAGLVVIKMFSDKIETLTEKTLIDGIEGVTFAFDNTHSTLEQGAESSFQVFKGLMGNLEPAVDKVEINGKRYSTLLKDGEPVTGRFDVVDRYTELTAGSVATIFAKDGDDFVRITTSLQTSEGQRAFGTLLNREHPAYQAMLNGDRFSGIATLFGKSYMTVYEPILHNGKVEGIYFIGYNIDSDMARLRSHLLSLDIGDGLGYFYALSTDGKFVAHRQRQDQTFSKNSPFQQMLDSSAGVLEYPDSAQTSDLTEDIRLAAFAKVDGFNWTIVASASKREMLAAAGLNPTFYTGSLIAMLVVIGFLALILSLIVRRELKPINVMAKRMDELSQTGDLSLRLVESENELGIVSKAFNALIDNMESSIKHTNEVMQNVAVGRFDKQIEGELKGDFKALQSRVNETVQSIRFTVSELSNVMNALNQGQFSVQINDDVQGEYQALMQHAKSAMHSLNGTVSGIVDVMSNMEQGRFAHRVNVEAKGDLLTLKNGVNGSMAALEKAMSDITQIVVAQSNGDLTHKINADYQGDLHTLKEAINTTADKLIVVVSQAVNASNIVSSASEEVSKGSQDLSQRVQQQAAALEQTSATMDEMSTVVQSNNQSAEDASELAKAVQQKATSGTKVMQQTIEAMRAIEESSNEISDIVTLIDSIAFQTNLLALNAAVEAARAGDHGRGFAVVASEVRALAQKSAEAAKKIKTLIDQSVIRIEQGTKLASESGLVLDSIDKAVDDVADMIQSIAKASAEQAEGIGQVHNAISQIDSVTQQNAALVEQTSAAAESMGEQASSLNQNMAFFKTSSTGHLGLPAPESGAQRH